MPKKDTSWMDGLDDTVRQAIDQNHDSPALTGTALGLTPNRQLYQDCADFYLLEELHRELFPWDRDERMRDPHLRPSIYDGRDNKLEWLSMDVNQTFAKLKRTLSNELAIYLSLASGGEMRYVAYQLTHNGVQRELKCKHKHSTTCCTNRKKIERTYWSPDFSGVLLTEPDVPLYAICQEKEMMKRYNPGSLLVGGQRIKNDCYMKHWLKSGFPKDWIEANRCDCKCPHDHVKGCRWSEKGQCGIGALNAAFIKDIQDANYVVDPDVFWLPPSVFNDLDNLKAHIIVSCCNHDHERSGCWHRARDKRLDLLGEPILDFLELMDYVVPSTTGKRTIHPKLSSRSKMWNRGAGWAHWSYIYSQDPGAAMDACATAFDLEEIWGSRTSVGGKKWGTCARLAADYYNNRITDQTFLDRCWTLQHNNGSIFNKYYGKMRTLMKTLEVQARNEYPKLATTYAHGYIGGLYRDHSVMTKKISSSDWLTMATSLTSKKGPTYDKSVIVNLLNYINGMTSSGGCIACQTGSFMKAPDEGGGKWDPCGGDGGWVTSSFCAYTDWFESQMMYYMSPYIQNYIECKDYWNDGDSTDWACLACWGKGDPCSWDRWDSSFPTINPDCVYAPGNGQALVSWTGITSGMSPNDFWSSESEDYDEEYDEDNNDDY